MKKLSLFLFVGLFLLFLSNCNKKYSSEEIKYITEIQNQRIEKDSTMKNSPRSPFNYKGKLKFYGLKYFDVNPEFVFKSKISEYPEKEVIQIFGTKGEERSAIRYGFLTFIKDSKEYKVNVYKNTAKDSSIYYSIWFTDKTTNNETYGVGRYLPFDLNQDKNHIYTLDFNLAFNPYCAYSSDYSCAIPSKEDYIDLEIKAGELKYHK